MEMLEGFTVLMVRSKPTHVWHKGMKNVLGALKNIGVFPEWKKPEEILAMTLTNKTVLVIADFNCDHFNDFSSTECLIVGPDCLMECIEKNICIPDNGSAIFNMAMSDFVITSTNMSKKHKEEVKKYIGWMGGCYTNNFTLAHTHLIADTMTSEKCHAAAETKKAIMSSEWVKKVWEGSLEDPFLRGDNEELVNLYRLPTFKGIEITLSNLTSAIKKKYKHLIEDNGGICAGSLTQNQTHYVVTDKCKGEKVKCAMAWGSVHVVNTQWLEQSVESKGPLPPKQYLFTTKPTCSTPTSELPSFMSADISAVVGTNNTTVGSTGSQHAVEESMNTTCQSVASYIPSLVKPKPVKPTASAAVVPPSPAPQSTEPNKSQTSLSDYDRYKKIIEDLKPSEFIKAGSFLDGCKICLINWNTSEGDKLRRLLVKGGAIVLTKITRGVTHVIAAQPPTDPSHLNVCQNVVTVEWVVACLSEGRPVDSNPYLIVPAAQSKPPPPSPLSHKGLELLKSKDKGLSDLSQRNGEHSFQPPVSRKLFEKTPKKKLMSNAEISEGFNNISADEGMDVEPIAADPKGSQKDNDTTSSCTQRSDASDTTNVRLFQGHVFVILGFDSENSTDVIKAIEAHGGSIVPPNFQGVPDFAVLPIEGVPDKFTATEVVNALWIEDCLEQGCLVDIRYYHQPVSIRAPGVSLTSAIICLSGFPQKERIFLSHLAIILGARVQEAFSRRDNPAKNVLKSTHLISNEASGSKYDAAIKWGIPVVSKNWLLEAAAKCTDNEPPSISTHQLIKQVTNQDEIIDKTPLNCKSKSTYAVTPLSSKTRSQLSATNHPCSNTNIPTEMDEAISNADTQPVNPVPDSATSLSNRTPDVPHSSQRTENVTPLVSKSQTSVSKDSRTSSSMFPTPGCIDEANKFHVSLNRSNGVGVKRKSRDGSPLKEFTPTTPSTPFQTPKNPLLNLSDISNASPFHVDTPEIPLGSAIHSNPDKNITKMYKKFIDSFPDFKCDTPLVSKKKSSPPFNVIMKQILAQIGGEVDGIETGTGKLLKEGVYSEWANSSTENSFSSPAGFGDSNKIVGNTSMGVRRKSPGSEKDSERRKSSNDKVNELLKQMDDIQNNSFRSDNQEEESPRMDRILERLQPVPNQEHNDIKSHPLNKIRPNTDHLFDAERPSTSSLDKGRSCGSNVSSNRSNVNSQSTAVEFEGDETQAESGTPTQPVPKRIFMLSSLPVDSKEKYEVLITGLGEKVSTSSTYEEESSHLVMETLVRNEKLLCSIASGKWVLHTSYLDQCYERRCFIPEDPYEWGNPLSESRLPKLEAGSQKDGLAKAAYRWRKNCTNLSQRAFKQMKAMLICRESSKPMFNRLLLAGGAQITEDPAKCNICLVEEGKVELSKSLLETLGGRSVPCVPLIYLSIFLVNYPNVSPSEYLVQQYVPFYKKK